MPIVTRVLCLNVISQCWGIVTDDSLKISVQAHQSQTDKIISLLYSPGHGGESTGVVGL